MNFGVYNDLTPLLEARYTFDLPWRKDSSLSPLKSTSSSTTSSAAPSPAPSCNTSKPPKAASASSSKESATSRKRPSPERSGRKGKNNFDVVKNKEEDKTSRVASERKASTKSVEEGPPASDLDDLAGILVGLSQKQQQKRQQQQALLAATKVDASTAAYFAAQRKKRRRTSPEELDILETTFKSDPMPNQALRQQLAQQLGMTPRRVQIWFQNKRAKLKRDSPEQPSSPASPAKKNKIEEAAASQASNPVPPATRPAQAVHQGVQPNAKPANNISSAVPQPPGSNTSPNSTGHPPAPGQIVPLSSSGQAAAMVVPLRSVAHIPGKTVPLAPLTPFPPGPLSADALAKHQLQLLRQRGPVATPGTPLLPISASSPLRSPAPFPSNGRPPTTLAAGAPAAAKAATTSGGVAIQSSSSIATPPASATAAIRAPQPTATPPQEIRLISPQPQMPQPQAYRQMLPPARMPHPQTTTL